MVTPLAHVGYAGKSAITAITALGEASTRIDDVVWSAIVTPSGGRCRRRVRRRMRRGVTGAARLSDRPSRRPAVTSHRTPDPSELGGSVREYSAPLNVEIPATGNLTDDVVTNAARGAGRGRVQPAAADDGLGRRHGRASSWPRSGPSPRAWSPPASAPATGSP